MNYSSEDFYLEYYAEEFEICQCSQENGIAKYHSESCEMPGSDACAGDPCQNGGLCTTIIQGETQACFIHNKKKFYKSKINYVNTMLKLKKGI